MTDLLVIANGKHQYGVAGRRWSKVTPRLREIFGNAIEIYFTSKKGDATLRTREALQSGLGWLAVAGGDGTINEVVNGYFDKERNIRPESALSFLPCGSGNDWARTLGLPLDLCEAVETLARSSVRSVDVGRARFPNLSSVMEERVFLNVAEAGVGGKLVARLNEGAGIMRGSLGYRLACIATALSYTPRKLHLVLDGQTAFDTGPLLSLIVAGGRYFGAGMQCAPMAQPDDGLLEVITLGDFGFVEILLKIRGFFSGGYLHDPKVKHHSVRSVEVLSGDNIFLELDGELVGTLPVNIHVLPHALKVRH